MKGQSIMDNPEKLATLDTLDIGRRKTKSQQKNKRCATLTPSKIGGKPRHPLRASCSCLLLDNLPVTHIVNMCLTSLYGNKRK